MPFWTTLVFHILAVVLVYHDGLLVELGWEDLLHVYIGLVAGYFCFALLQVSDKVMPKQLRKPGVGHCKFELSDILLVAPDDAAFDYVCAGMDGNYRDSFAAGCKAGNADKYSAVTEKEAAIVIVADEPAAADVEVGEIDEDVALTKDLRTPGALEQATPEETCALTKLQCVMGSGSMESESNKSNPVVVEHTGTKAARNKRHVFGLASMKPPKEARMHGLIIRQDMGGGRAALRNMFVGKVKPFIVCRVDVDAEGRLKVSDFVYLFIFYLSFLYVCVSVSYIHTVHTHTHTYTGAQGNSYSNRWEGDSGGSPSGPPPLPLVHHNN